MSEYYAVTRSTDYLEHYGVKGMKWGVKKARLVTLEDKQKGAKKLGKQFAKASKKLAKLEKRGANGKKYAKRAAALGAAGAALGAAGALGSMENLQKVKRGLDTVVGKRAHLSPKGLRRGGPSDPIARAASDAGKGLVNYGAWGSKNLGSTGLSRHGAIRLGSMAAGAGLAGAAGYNAYRAATAGRNRKKAEQFRSEMKKAFAGTEYANRIPSGSNSSASSKPRHGKKRRSARS